MSDTTKMGIFDNDARLSERIEEYLYVLKVNGVDREKFENFSKKYNKEYAEYIKSKPNPKDLNKFVEYKCSELSEIIGKPITKARFLELDILYMGVCEEYN